MKLIKRYAERMAPPETAIAAAVEEYRKQFEGIMVEEVKALSLRYPAHAIECISGMGAFGIGSYSKNGEWKEYFKHPLNKLFIYTLDQLAYSGVPAPIRITGKNGDIIIDRSW